MQKSLESALLQAKKSGFFSYPNKSLTQIPQELINFPTVQLPNMTWWEASPLIRLDLSNNQLETLLSDLLLLNPDVISLRVQNNKLISLPPDFFPEKCELKSLDLTTNQLKSLPNSLSYNKSLVEILAPNNALEEFPNVSSVKTLEILQLNNNKLINPPCISGLNKLKILNLSNNKLKFLPSTVFQGLNSMEQLILRSNLIPELSPDIFSDLKKLVLLDLSENQLEQFQLSSDLQNLDSLLLAYNKLKKASNLNFFPNLTVLDLKNNKLKVLESSVTNLKKLKTLDLTNNDLSDLPNELGLLQNLVRICFIGNPIKSIKPALRESKAEDLKQYLRGRMSDADKFDDFKTNDPWQVIFREFLVNNELVVREQKLENIDSRVFEIKQLKVLDLSQNLLKDFKGNFSGFSCLKTVKINNNFLETAPKGLEELKTLQDLELQGNRLKEFYEKEIFQWKNIQVLDLARNLLNKVPKLIPNLTTLKSISLAYNQIRDFDILCCETLKGLNVLDLSNNKIETISENLWVFMINLTHLNLENNEIIKVPSEIGFMNVLKSFKIDGNPIKLLRRQVIEKGSNEIMAFLRSRHVGQIPEIARKMEIEEEKCEENHNFNEIPQTIGNFNKNEENKIINNENLNRIEKNFNKNEKNLNNNQSMLDKNISNNLTKHEEYANKQEELSKIEYKIKQLEDEIASNYSLNNFQKNSKKKELQQLIIQRNIIKK